MKIISCLRRVPVYSFLFGCGACTALLLGSVGIYGAEPDQNRALAACLFVPPYNSDAGVLLYNVLSSYESMSVWLITLFPVFGAMPYAGAYCSEFKSCGFYLSCSRMSRRSFTLSHFAAMGLYSALTMLVSLGAVTVLCLVCCGGAASAVPLGEIARLYISYCAYALVAGCVCIALCSAFMDTFVITSGMSLVIYILDSLYSTYQLRLLAALTRGEVTEPDPRAELLYIPFYAHGFPQFREATGLSPWVLVLGAAGLAAGAYGLFAFMTARRIRL
ncbi:MAG: hypothetical protein IJ746_03285 [Ruminococcus sp.]|nr:hypothetical protein [Ruminococcus sp.]